MRAGLAARRAAAVAVAGFAFSRLALAVALATLAARVVAEDEARQLDLRQRNRDRVIAGAPDQLARREVAAQIRADAAAHDLTEARAVGLDAKHGAWARLSSPVLPLRPLRPLRSFPLSSEEERTTAKGAKDAKGEGHDQAASVELRFASPRAKSAATYWRTSSALFSS